MNPQKSQPIHTRIAPSPTGFLHIGTARTALFNYLFARHNKGKFYLRIEDTDIERSKSEYEKEIIESLKWLGLKWDGKILKQSQRQNVYKKYIGKLLKSGEAFWCFHTKEELEKEKKDQQKRGVPQVHFCNYKNTLNKTKEFLQKKQYQGVIRLKCPQSKTIKFNDLIRGPIEFNTNQIGDIVIARNEQTPLYNLAVVIDDYKQKITHIIRGEDHISNTPKQILIIEALGLPQPLYAHIPLTLAPDRSKLSKRHGAVAISEFRQQGYLPEALINFMALLGWNPGDDREYFTLKQLLKEFSLGRMQKSSAIFNIDKLDSINSHYIRKKKIKELTKLCIPCLTQQSSRARGAGAAIPAEDSQSAGLLRRLPPPRNDKFEIIDTGEIVDKKWLEKIVKLEQERMKKLSEIGDLTAFFFKNELDYDSSLLQWKNMTKQEIGTSIDTSYHILSDLETPDFKEEKLKEILMPIAEKMGDRGRLLWPLRVALSGLKASPGPFEIIATLGKQNALKRLKTALGKL